MWETRRAALSAAVVCALIAAVGAAQAAPARHEGSESTRAVVHISPPTLPVGRSPAARARWHALRADSRGLLAQVADRNGLRVESVNPETGSLSVELGPGGLAALRADLADDPRVVSVRPDVPAQLRYAPNDFAFAHPDSHAPNQDVGDWHLIREGAPRAWDLSKGNGAEVAVVDSGADGSNPDLANRIVGGASFGTSSAPTTDSVGHGTHTAGLACGDSDNGFGIASIGFRCGLFIAKFDEFCSDVANGITAAANRDSDVISMSLGGCNSAIVPALSYAQSRGSVLVAAADNAPNPTGSCGTVIGDPMNCTYPQEWVQPKGTGPNASFDRGLVVTSAQYNGTRSSFAEQTSRVSVAAFGSASNSIGGQQGILSTWPANGVSDDAFGGRTSLNGDSRFAYLVGTSMATPQAAGVAALIRAVKPGMANTKIVHLIKATASHCGSYGAGIGWGLVRADQAVAAALGRDIEPPSSRISRASRIRGAGRVHGKLVLLRIERKDSAVGGCVKLPVTGVRKVAVFASVNKGPYHRIAKTRRERLRFRAKRGRRYRFYSSAIDKAGNREPAPRKADVVL